MFSDQGHGSGGFRRIDGDPDQFRSGSRQFGTLNGGCQIIAVSVLVID